jgi:hypothetical protein
MPTAVEWPHHNCKLSGLLNDAGDLADNRHVGEGDPNEYSFQVSDLRLGDFSSRGNSGPMVFDH